MKLIKRTIAVTQRQEEWLVSEAGRLQIPVSDLIRRVFDAQKDVRQGIGGRMGRAWEKYKNFPIYTASTDGIPAYDPATQTYNFGSIDCPGVMSADQAHNLSKRELEQRRRDVRTTDPMKLLEEQRPDLAKLVRKGLLNRKYALKFIEEEKNGKS